MSEEVNPLDEEDNPLETQPSKISKRKAPPIDLNTVDSMLQVFVYLATVAGYEFPITLNVGGLLVTGHIMSKRSYLDDVREKTKPSIASLEQGHQEFLNGILEAMTRIKEDETYETEEKLRKIKPEEILYIHLRNARIFISSNKPIPSQGSFTWRGRINAVDGFTLGILSFSEGQS